MRYAVEYLLQILTNFITPNKWFLHKDDKTT